MNLNVIVMVCLSTKCTFFQTLGIKLMKRITFVCFVVIFDALQINNHIDHLVIEVNKQIDKSHELQIKQ